MSATRGCEKKKATHFPWKIINRFDYGDYDNNNFPSPLDWIAGTYSFGKYEKDSQNPVYKISLRASLIGHVLPSLVLGQVGRFYSELVRIRALGEVWQTTFLFFFFFSTIMRTTPFYPFNRKWSRFGTWKENFVPPTDIDRQRYNPCRELKNRVIELDGGKFVHPWESRVSYILYTTVNYRVVFLSRNYFAKGSFHYTK